MGNRFWKYIAWGWFIVQTWCIFLLLEVIVTGKVYLNMFLLIFAVMLYMNRNLIRPRAKRV